MSTFYRSFGKAWSRLLLSATMVITSSAVTAQTGAPSTGITHELARQRAAIISDLRYELALSIPVAPSERLSGTMDIHVTLSDASAPLVLDFEAPDGGIDRVEANGSEAVVNLINGHLVIPSIVLQAGANKLHIQFKAGDAALNRNADFLYTLFVPARARLVLPCFDQPDLKGRWTLRLDHPAEWQSVANGAELDRVIQGNRAQVRFAPTEPLPTYLFAFAAGDFKIDTATRNGRMMRMFHRENDPAKLARNREAIFDLHAQAVGFMERYTGIPYAFGKFDFVAIPSFQFGGMEHAGKILYRASSLMLDESATQEDQLKRAELIAHETAHMWFGDLVTMRWFDDVWTKEVFANFMAAKIVNPSFPALNHDLRFFLDHYRGAYQIDRTAGANPIGQVLDNLNNAGSMYGAIIYQKSPVVMRHLEALLGEDNLRDGLRDYLRNHAFANATWKDLVRLLEPRTSIDLKAWSRVWVEQAGRPLIKTGLAVKNGRIAHLRFEQSDPHGRGLEWPQRLHVAVGNHPSFDAELSGASVAIPGAVGLATPPYVLPSAGGWAYADFELDSASLAYLLNALPDIENPLDRASAWVTLWDNLLAGRIPPTRFVDLALRALPLEHDEQITSAVLDYALNAWWQYLDNEQRSTRASHIEAVLQRGLTNATTTSQKAIWFAALRDSAQTPATLSWLQEIWAKQRTIPNLPLAEVDFSRLAQHLAVREIDGWQAMLERQLQAIKDPDQSARFKFVMPALSADAATRKQWFQSLVELPNRRREPWVLEGLRFLHHPLRTQSAEELIRPSLEMLAELQKTGDIFFPGAWAQATLRSHHSTTAAENVHRFLNTLPPDYPLRLKNITLQAADGLFRAEEIRRQ